MTTPAKKLAGLTLDGGWRVVEPIPVSPNATGGHFSAGYIVESPRGMKAFLKALDFSAAITSLDPARYFQWLTESFNFERDVLAKCRDRRLDRVVVAITDGLVRVEAQPVQYLIFELAEGDVRSQADFSKRFDVAWSLRSLHHVATGLSQLHKEGIAHQDLKPSNVLLFERRTLSKIADLGRAAYKGHSPPHETMPVAGDRTYAPPELLYGYADPEWNLRRLGCDAYLLGSMVVFFFAGSGVTASVQALLRDTHRWQNWGGTYDDVLPYVRDAFGHVLAAFEQEVSKELRSDLLTAVSELCEPDPRLRGHPLNRASRGNQYSLERYISKFNLLATRAEVGLAGNQIV